MHRLYPSFAPFRIVLETPWQERIGIILYAFRSTSRVTRNRPADEARFQVKYGPRTDEPHAIFDDPYKLYATLMVGIDLESGVVVSADPAVHNPTRFYISVEYKTADADLALTRGWHAWERAKRGQLEPIEILVGCSQARVLDLVMFERMAQNLDQGHRQLLAEQVADGSASRRLVALQERGHLDQHSLLTELAVERDVLLDIIQGANRLKTAVRGWVAQHHLHDLIAKAPGVRSCEAIEEDGKPDFRVSIGDAPHVMIECKNVLRKTNAQGVPRLDFQRTRASKEIHALGTTAHPSSRLWRHVCTRFQSGGSSCTSAPTRWLRMPGAPASFRATCSNGSWTGDLAGLLASLR